MLNRFRRHLLGGLLLGSLVGAGSIGTTHAQINTCRTDPKVWLSNGVEVDLSAGQSGAVGQVSQIVYNVHVPAGLTVTKITYTGGVYANKETMNIVTDAPAGSYNSTTTVYSNSTNMATAVDMSLKSLAGRQVTGMVNSPMAVQLVGP